MSNLTSNINAETGIPFGIVSANKLDSDLVQDLLDNGVNYSYEEAAENLAFENGFEPDSPEHADYEGDFWAYLSDKGLLDDVYDAEEPFIEGVYENVTYSTVWLGGALNFFIVASPVIGHHAKCSPCVPNAGNIDEKGDYECYSVPEDWFYKE